MISGRSGRGNLGPLGGAAGDEPRPFVAEPVLLALRGGLHLPSTVVACSARPSGRISLSRSADF